MTCYVQGNDINITKGDKFNFIITSTDGVSASDKCELYIGQNEGDVTQSPVKSLETPIILEDKQFRFNIKTNDMEVGTYYYTFTINNQQTTKEAFGKFIVLEGATYESEVDKSFVESINISIDNIVAEIGLNDTDPATVKNYEEISTVENQLLLRLKAISNKIDEINNEVI